MKQFLIIPFFILFFLGLAQGQDDGCNPSKEYISKMYSHYYSHKCEWLEKKNSIDSNSSTINLINVLDDVHGDFYPDIPWNQPDSLKSFANHFVNYSDTVRGVPVRLTDEWIPKQGQGLSSLIFEKSISNVFEEDFQWIKKMDHSSVRGISRDFLVKRTNILEHIYENFLKKSFLVGLAYEEDGTTKALLPRFLESQESREWLLKVLVTRKNQGLGLYGFPDELGYVKLLYPDGFIPSDDFTDEDEEKWARPFLDQEFHKFDSIEQLISFTLWWGEDLAQISDFLILKKDTLSPEVKDFLFGFSVANPGWSTDDYEVTDGDIDFLSNLLDMSL